MTAVYADRVWVGTATTGTGTINLGTALTGYRTFASAVTAGNLASGNTVYYAIVDGSAWEVGLGTYTAGSPDTLTRSVAASSAGGTAISLDGTATVFITLTQAGLASFNRVNIDQGTSALTSGTTINTNAAAGNVFTLTLATNATLANPTNLQAGAHYQWLVRQDTTGSRTLSFGTAFLWANRSAPTLSTTANYVDVINAVSPDGTNLYCTFSPNFG